MFNYADVDGDGRISWSEFQTMINPPLPPQPEKPHLSDLAKRQLKGKEDVSNGAVTNDGHVLCVPKTMAVVSNDTVSSNCAEASWSSIVRGTPT